MATYDRYINSDPAIGNDTTGDGSINSPWLTLNKANNLTVGSDFYHFYLTDNDWTYPYRATGEDVAAIAPAYGDLTNTDNFEWHCNGAVITGTARLTGVTWTLFPGSSYVYYCNPSWATEPNVLIGIDTEITWIGENAIWFQKLTAIPSNMFDHCWYYDATGDILYVCDHSGDPDTTGVLFEYGDKDRAVNASAKGNHTIIGGRIFPGQLQCLLWNGPYNSFLRNKFFYGGSSSVFRLEGTTCKDNLIAYNLMYGVRKDYSYGVIHYNTDGVSGLPNYFYNNTVYAGDYGAYVSKSGAAQAEASVWRNNLFVDHYTAAFTIQSGASIDEDYNAFGISGNDVASLTIGLTSGSGSHSIPPSDTSSATNVGVYYPETSFIPQSSSVVKDAGVELTEDNLDQDIRERKIIGFPDIGAYEIAVYLFLRTKGGFARLFR